MSKQRFTMPDGETVEKEMPQWKTPYNHDREFESERTALYCNDESLTKQEFKEDADINVILKRFMRGGEPPPAVLPEHFMDLSGRTNYYDMATKVAEANETFYLLPAEKRAEFQNDPTRWADAVVAAVDQGNRKALAALGIEVPPERPREPPTATPAVVATPAPTPAGEAPGAPASGAPAPGTPGAHVTPPK